MLKKFANFYYTCDCGCGGNKGCHGHHVEIIRYEATGPTGPQGPTGVTGVTGPTGPTGATEQAP